MSQRYNLYFACSMSRMSVFTPQYPDQRITRIRDACELYIPPGRDGIGKLEKMYLPERPDPLINQVMVADLGDEEMVACVLDDGDLVAWWTRPIKDWVDGHITEYKEILSGCELRPFLQQTLDKGAWGVAAHTKARMLAASSNDLTVRVFAFGLSDVKVQADDANYLQEDWPHFKPSSDTSTLNRSNNVQIVLRGHEANIPSISFCNSPDDPAGKYLVSTDISGRAIIWNVHQGCSIREIRAPGANTQAFDRLLAGWGAFWVDRRAFCRTTADKIGACNIFTAPTETRFTLDLSISKATVRRTGRWSIGDRSDSLRSSDDEASTLPMMTSQGPRIDASHEDVLFGGSSEEETELDADAEVMLNDTIMTSQDLVRHSSFIRHELLMTSPPGQRHLDFPPCPLIFTNPFSICLLQPMLNVTTGSITSSTTSTTSKISVSCPFRPSILIRQLLDQDMDLTWKSRLAHYERLNLCVPIPELGVLLAGSPTGRVAVLTLHQFLFRPPPPTSAPVYTLRLEHLLPFASQESAGVRPAVQLVGVAAAPLQGHEERIGARTWRVVLLYKNGRMLNYEIEPAAAVGMGVGGSVEMLLV